MSKNPDAKINTNTPVPEQTTEAIDVCLYSLAVVIKTDQPPEEINLTSLHRFDAAGNQVGPKDPACFEIQGDKQEGGFFRLLDADTRLYYNGTPAAEFLKGGSMGDTIRKMKEGDVVTFYSRKGNATAVLVFHERAWKNVTWATLPLDPKEDAYYISRHEEEIETPEIQTDDEPLPRHYAILRNTPEGWTVEDHSTHFGVFVNNIHIRETHPLQYMDLIRLGHTLFLFMGDHLVYNHMQYGKNQLQINIKSRVAGSFFSKKVLLKDVAMDINVGEMVLILGGSGAGKTTFINAVMGYEKADGVIKEGEVDVYKEYSKVKYDIGFVPQQDLLRMEDTVYETLANAAEMKMPSGSTSMERDARINEILELFGLEAEKNNLVGKLSGGQRKRLSICVEYIAKPSLFFLDEPDSGLDGVMARHLMEQLRIIADQDKIVMVITHAPDRAADLFDKVIVLAKSSEDKTGHLAFFGNVDECFDFFETETLEGVVKRINRLDEGGEGLADEYIARYNQIKNIGMEE